MPKQSLPAIAGYEAEILALVQQANPAVLTHSNLKLEQFQSAFACALHMHQPTIPAGANGELISHLQYMLEHSEEGDNHNAEPFAHCYKRLA
ncbi:glycosyl hydrolase family 57, partial [Cyanobacteria bacterium 150SLHB]|nr:glycosyl hydrolase family 57 [Prochlorococcus sp. P1344]